ncbi:MAG: thiol reductase thioredoxin [bacterium]|nr:thiol reductase thioredoxin [bacterium]
MRPSLLFALVCLPVVAGAADGPKEALPFIEDDYGRAVAQAKKLKLPLFVDAWAPWCHTCRFLRAYVFTDASLHKHSGRFVWLSIDTEKEKNAPFLAKYPVEVWPTLMVVDAAREQAVLRWPGSVNAAQLVKLLDDGERAAHGDTGAGLGELAHADRLNAEGKKKEAAAAYRAALPHLPADKQPRAIESLIAGLQMAHEAPACAQTAIELTPAMVRGPSFANAVGSGLGCAASLKGDDRARALAKLEPLAEEALKLPGLLADDRSGLYETMVDLRDEGGDSAGKKTLAARWLSFLEGEAAKATAVEQRAAFDPHRVNAALAMGEPLRAEAALKQSEHDLPADYNPPARLGLIYRAAGRLDDALAAVDRALPKVYGPRAMRLYQLKTDIQIAKGDREGARKTLQKALQVARALPAEQRRDEFVASIEKKLASAR